MSEPMRPNDLQPLEPKDLNNQLRSLYDQLPPYRLFKKTELFERIINNKWNNSEHRKLIIGKVRDLLRKSSTTPTFQDIMIGFFDAMYLYGKKTDVTPPGQLGPRIEQRLIEEMIESEGPDDSAGIFEPTIAKKKELKIFKIAQQNFFDHVAVSLDTSVKADEDEIKEGELPMEEDPELITFRDKVNTWRNELRDIYGEEVLSS